MKNRCVIVGGADISNPTFVKRYLKEGDFSIYCDSGLYHEEKLGIKGDLVVGDFDSHPKPETDTSIIELPREKDDTDTIFAVKEAIKMSFKEIIMVGVIGNRIDHSLANIYALNMINDNHIKGYIIDDFSVLEMVYSKPVYISEDYDYFSLININGKAEGITIKNAKYPLERGTIEPYYQYGVSNEVLKDKKASVSVKEGSLLLVKVYRDSKEEKRS